MQKKGRDWFVLTPLTDDPNYPIRFHQEQHIGLKVIPPAYRKIWTLNHGSNTTWCTSHRFVS